MPHSHQTATSLRLSQRLSVWFGRWRSRLIAVLRNKSQQIAVFLADRTNGRASASVRLSVCLYYG